MSVFMKPEAFLLPAGVTQATIQSTIDGKWIAQGWQRITNDTTNFISDFIPPASETTGDGRFRQVLRIYYNTADISFSMYDYPITDAFSQMHRIYEKTGGAVAAAVSVSSGSTIGFTGSISGTTMTVTGSPSGLAVGSPINYSGSPAGLYISALLTGTGGNGTYTLSANVGTVASQAMTAQGSTTITGATGTASSTAKDNLWALYVALKQSTDPNVTGWKYTYLPNYGGVDNILCERTTISPNVVSFFTSTTVNAAIVGEPRQAGSLSVGAIAATLGGKTTVTIDRTNGFYVYMSIFSRTIAIGVKTTTNYFGPMFASWIPNADALAMVPLKPSWLINKPCWIQEGFFGLVAGTASAPVGYYNVKTTCSIGLAFAWMYIATSTPAPGGQTLWVNGATGGCIPNVAFMFSAIYHFSNTADVFKATRIGTDGSTASNYLGSDIANIGMSGSGYLPNPNIFNGTTQAGFALAPSAYFDDIFVSDLQSNDGNEVTCVAPMALPAGISLAQDLGATTAYTTILLNTVAGLATSGTNYVMIGAEVFSYAGVSGGNTLTGVTRAYNASPQQNHFTDDPVQQGGWFVKMNGGFLFMGTNRPVAA